MSLDAPFRIAFDNARDPYTARNALGITGTGSGSGAPTDAQYIVAVDDPTLTNDRVLTNTATVTWDFSTAGQAKANAATSGGGNVSNSGTPTVGQYAKWVTATTIQGVAPATVLSDIGAQPAGSYQPLDATLTALAAYNTNGLLTQTAADTFTGRSIAVPAAGISITNANGVSGNPTLALANDLAALEALAGTNTIYYRSGTDTWSSVTIGSNLTFTGGTLAATGGGSTTYTSIGAGRLTYVSATALKFAPFNGNQIKINGTFYNIPTAGIAGVANTSVFVNGTGGSNLAASTVYWVFAFSNSGTVTADFRTAATHAASTTAGNEGVEIRTGDDTRTLIGLCRTNASSQFADTATQRFVRSWFNPEPQNFTNGFTAARSTASASFVELNTEIRCEFVTWAIDIVTAALVGYSYNGTPAYAYSAVGWDGAATVVGAANIAAANYGSTGGSVGVSESKKLSEGYHYITYMGASSSGTSNFGVGVNALSGRVG